MLMSRDIELKIMNDQSLTKEEAETYLNWVSKEVRKNQNIIDPYDTDCSKCFECSRDVAVVVMGAEILPVPINIRNQLNISLTHYSTAITLNVDNQLKSYLIDLTYSQFFKEKFILDNREKGSIKHNDEDKEKNKFEDDLRNKGYFELTDENFKFYVNNFFELGKIDNRLIKNTRLNEFRSYLNKSGIIIKGVNLSSKKELLTQLKDEIKFSQIVEVQEQENNKSL